MIELPPDRLALFEEVFRRQTKTNERLQSPVNAHLLTLCTEDLLAGGITADILSDWYGDPVQQYVATRFMGALHHLVLTGDAPELAGHYPSVGGQFNAATFADALFPVLHRHAQQVRAFIEGPPQTNEVNRSAVLIGGYSEVVRQTGLPLRCLEVGASAGLNLLWRNFHYDLGDQTWGDKASAVRVASDWRGNLPQLVENIELHSAAGCDLAPIDLLDPDNATLMEAYVWTDQPIRFDRLRAAIDLAQHSPPQVEQMGAADWLDIQLSEPIPGVATVIYHSVVAQYFDADTQTRFRNTIHEAGARATNEAPLAWLSFEHPESYKMPDLSLTLWPGGERRHLATAHPHGAFAEWH